MATVLIIDDEEEICDLLEDVFKQEKGFAVLKTDNGEDGVELVKGQRPDVILLDIKLQVGMDGVDAGGGDSSEISANDPTYKISF